MSDVYSILHSMVGYAIVCVCMRRVLAETSIILIPEKWGNLPFVLGIFPRGLRGEASWVMKGQ